jgi:hypothetical protein
MRPALNLMDWLVQIAGCQNDPDAINFDGAEDALLELQERAQECFDYCAGAEESAQTALLFEMGQTMERIAGSLDEFLETELFYHLEEAIAECSNLMLLREQIAGAEADTLG